MKTENPMFRRTLMDAARGLAGVALLATLAACSGGASTQENPVTSLPPVSNYTGPAPSNADVQAFRVNLWENIKANNRCGGCHNATGQSPQFARNDDVNLAYQAAVSIVNLTQPDQSRMVVKVAEGHNCWLPAASACADTLTVWIRNWAGDTAAGGRTIELQAPPVIEVGASKSFPADATLFAQYLWNMPPGNETRPPLQKYCARCHSPTAAQPQSPFFASANLEEAYAAARARINLEDPAKSRFVVRLREESHNCWSDCAQNAADMEAAIRDFAAQITATPVDPSLVISKALTLYDGTVAAGGNRYDNNVIALYEFKTGDDFIAYDTSGVEPALNLQLSGDFDWVGGWGIMFRAGSKAQGSTVASRKLAEMIKATGEFSIEVWANNANVAQEDAYIVSYSAGNMARNFTLAQRMYSYEAMTRTSETDANGRPVLLTNANDRDAQAALQHVVLTYDPVNGRRIYVNGEFTGDVDPRGGGGTLADWDDTFALVLGNETSSNRQWQGVLRLVAIHNRALTLEQIQQNFAAGVGEKYFMLFNVSHLVDVPQAYVMLEATQLDSYAYLFNKPTFISLDPDAQIPNIEIRGVRIGINGAEAKVGQTYATLQKSISAQGYQAGAGQLLAETGAVIALEKGPVEDQFFLSFEQIGTHAHPYVEPVYPPPPEPEDGEGEPEVGLRTFDELNATMAEITGVSPTTQAVRTTYETLKQQLPTVENIGTFLAAHQTGVAQLAIKYCSALVDNTGLRNEFWKTEDNQIVDVANLNLTTETGRNLLIDPLVRKAVGVGLIEQPTQAVIRQELGSFVEFGTPAHKSLIERLCPGGTCNSDRKLVVAKAACAAVLGSSAVLVH
jgi:cytochrome c553